MAVAAVKEGTRVVAIRLRDLRRRRGLTQEELAERAGVEQPQISAWEGGRRTPTMENVKKLAKGFGMRDDELARELGFLDPAPARDGTAHGDPGDIFDRAPLARLVAELEALPTAPGQPTFADEMRQAERMSPERRARFQRRLARLFLFMLREELEREEEEGE